MTAKISVFVVCVEVIIYLLLCNLRDFTFNEVRQISRKKVDFAKFRKLQGVIWLTVINEIFYFPPHSALQITVGQRSMTVNNCASIDDILIIVTAEFLSEIDSFHNY